MERLTFCVTFYNGNSPETAEELYHAHAEAFSPQEASVMVAVEAMQEHGIDVSDAPCSILCSGRVPEGIKPVLALIKALGLHPIQPGDPKPTKAQEDATLEAIRKARGMH